MTPARIARRCVTETLLMTGIDKARGALAAETIEVFRPAHVTMSGGRIYYQLLHGPEERVPDGVLTAFCALADAPAADVVAFANTYGVLGLCRHGFPATHSPRCAYRVGQAWYAEFRREHVVRAPIPDRLKRSESMRDWRIWARRFYTVADQISRLRTGAPVGPLESALFGADAERRIDPADWEDDRPGWRWYCLSDLMNLWLDLAGLVPHLTARGPDGEFPEGSDDPEFFVYLAGPLFPAVSIFGALVLQLLSLFTGGRQYTCSGCGRLYTPRKTPKPYPVRHYCDTCRASGKPMQNARAEYRKRQRDRRARARKRKGAQRGK
jgi:hypothetical protein